ncbi:MAG TPA: HupE/UreJ family protein [Gemmatimonadales bacterium]|nr:HupE/UreJ family protein [Gemmatimonadales bacterium]
MHPRTSRLVLAVALAAGPSVLHPALAAGHEIPSRVTVLAFIRPEGRLLRVVVRVPLEAMRDMEFPLKGEGFLDLARVGPELEHAARLWIASSLTVEENGVTLGDPRIVATQVSLPADRSFETYPDAIAHIAGPPLPPETELVWQQGMLDVLLEYPISSDHSSFSVDPTLARLGLRTTTVLRFLPPGGAERVYQFTGDPGLVRLDPRWHQAALRFVRLGFLHILDGIDHLLFLLCLVIPFRRLRPLVAIVTSFTVAHSITLIASSLGLAPTGLWFAPLIETLIALSIVYMALENILGARLERRWLLAFGFGLIHGFGFSFFLRESLQFAGSHLATSLFSFNIGVELGQLFVLLLAVPVLSWLFRRVPERAGTIVLSAIVAHTAWHWMTERGATLLEYRFQWPALDVVTLASVMRMAMLVLIVGIVGWLMYGLARRIAPVAPKGEPAVEPERS